MFLIELRDAAHQLTAGQGPVPIKVIGSREWQDYIADALAKERASVRQYSIQGLSYALPATKRRR